MSVIHFPVPLMTAAERAGFSQAVAIFRQEADRARRYAARIGDAPVSVPAAEALEQHQKNEILLLCAKFVDLIAERIAEDLPKPLH